MYGVYGVYAWYVLYSTYHSYRTHQTYDLHAKKIIVRYFIGQRAADSQTGVDWAFIMIIMIIEIITTYSVPISKKSSEFVGILQCDRQY